MQYSRRIPIWAPISSHHRYLVASPGDKAVLGPSRRALTLPVFDTRRLVAAASGPAASALVAAGFALGTLVALVLVVGGAEWLPPVLLTLMVGVLAGVGSRQIGGVLPHRRGVSQVLRDSLVSLVHGFQPGWTARPLARVRVVASESAVSVARRTRLRRP